VRSGWFCLAVVLSCAGNLPGAPLDLHQVAGDAKWVVHLDVDAMHHSELMENAYLTGLQQWQEFGEWLDVACSEIGVDARTDLFDITLFGTSFDKLVGTAVVHAKMDQQVMIARAKLEATFSSSKYRQYEVYQWRSDSEMVVGSFFRPSILVVARTGAEVTKALDVLDGKAGNLSHKRPFGSDGPRAGTMAVAWGTGLEEAPLPWKSAVGKKTSALEIFVGEHQGAVFATANLHTESGETAKRVLAVLEGMRASAELQFEGDAALCGLLKGVKLQTAGGEIVMDFQASAKQTWNHVGELMKRVQGR